MNKVLLVADVTSRTAALVRGHVLAMCLAAFVSSAFALVNSGALQAVSTLVQAVVFIACVYQWSHAPRPGIPFAPLILLMDLVWYATPQVIGATRTQPASDHGILAAATALFLYQVSLIVCNVGGSRRPRRVGNSVRMLHVDTPRRVNRWCILAGTVLFTCSLVDWSILLGSARPILERLPVGVINPIRTVCQMGECGSVLFLSFVSASGRASFLVKLFFSLGLCSALLAALASMLLSQAGVIFASLLLGLFLGTGRPPVVATLAIAAGIGFLNLSKFEVRSEYWASNAGQRQLTPETIGSFFAFWCTRSFTALTTTFFGDAAQLDKRELQRLSTRLDNLKMLVFVSDALERGGYSPLYGRTYALIPVATVPRILWPSKPRAHIAQEELNVHFGLQTRSDTHLTYIAWGLLPEAVGNFGPLIGPVLLGVVLGSITAYLSNACLYLPIFAVRAIITSVLLVILLQSTCMVSTLVVSMITNALLVMCPSLWLFSKRQIRH